MHDRTRGRAHALNPTAAAVLDSVDGHRSIDDLVIDVGSRFAAPVDLQTVESAIVELSAAGLVQVRGPQLERRQVLRKAAATAAVGAVALPIVQSIATPSVAAAQSGGGDQEPDPDPDPDPGELLAGTAVAFGGSIQGTQDAPLATARFNGPRGLAVAPDGTIDVVDTDNERIRAISPAGVVSTLAGSTRGYANGTGEAARFNRPAGVAVGPTGLIYVADSYNNRIRTVTPAGAVSTLAGSTYGNIIGYFAYPHGLTVATDGHHLRDEHQWLHDRRAESVGRVLHPGRKRCLRLRETHGNRGSVPLPPRHRGAVTHAARRGCHLLLGRVRRVRPAGQRGALRQAAVGAHRRWRIVARRPR
ncbi:MAG: PqqD family peptide modification chaperone [Microthrixaceae bacterium]